MVFLWTPTDGRAAPPVVVQSFLPFTHHQPPTNKHKNPNSIHNNAALSATNRAWRHHLGEEAQWRRLFDARWSHCYEGQGRLTVSPSILAALNGNYRSFWGTIEKVEVSVGFGVEMIVCVLICFLTSPF